MQQSVMELVAVNVDARTGSAESTASLFVRDERLGHLGCRVLPLNQSEFSIRSLPHLSRSQVITSAPLVAAQM
jgi:hypothetical protein